MKLGVVWRVAAAAGVEEVKGYDDWVSCGVLQPEFPMGPEPHCSPSLHSHWQGSPALLPVAAGVRGMSACGSLTVVAPCGGAASPPGLGVHPYATTTGSAKV